MRTMTARAPRRYAAAGPVAAVVLASALVACGEQQAGVADPGGGVPSRSSTLLQPEATVSAQSPQAGGASTSAAREPDARTEGPADAPPNYEDNHSFRKTVPLSPADRRTGEEAAARIVAALEPLRAGVPYDEATVLARLREAGYADALVQVGPESASFDVSVTGVCVSGTMRPDAVRTDVHGVYVEGGCRKPRGGH